MGPSKLHRVLLLFVASIAVVLISGCGATAVNSANSSATGNQLSPSTNTLDFGGTTVGTTSSKTLTITASGTSSVTVNQLTVSPTDFTVSGPSVPFVIAPGQSATINASVNPQAAGTISGTMLIASTAANSPNSVALTTVASTPAAPVLSVNPTSLNFGSVTVGTSSAKSVVVSNTGNAVLSISQANLTGSGYSISGLSLPLTLAAGASSSFIVDFAPSTTGTISGNLSLVSTASNSPGSLPLTGTATAAPVAQLSVSPTTANFGNVTVGSTGTQSIVISNTGNTSVTISQITTSGTGFSGSGIVVPRTLSPGQSATYTATFAPASATSASGQISFASNANNSPSLVSLSGTGVAAPVAQLTASPASVSFGNVTLGSTGTQSVSISNTGNVSVTISQVTTSGTGFSGSGITVPVTLSPGQSATYTATFAPTSAASASGQISFTSNATNSPNLVSLSGTGVSSPSSQLSAGTNLLAFGNVPVGSTSSLSGTLTASGGSVTISSDTVTGAGYSLIGLTLPVTLAAGQSASFNVVFAPTSAGSSTGGVSFASNASNSPTTVSFSGTGVALQLNSTPTSLSFGNVSTGGSKNLSGTLTASGGSVTVSSAAVTGSGYSVSGLTFPATLSAGQSATFNVTFAPSATGSVTGNVSFASNASNSPTTVSLSGTGVAPQLTVSPTSLAFGNVTVGSTSSLSGTLTASGGSVAVSSSTITGTGYSLTGITLPVTLSAGQSTGFTVSFAPSSTGTVTGNLKFTSNASNSPTSLSLSGTGVTSTATPCGLIDDGLVHIPPTYNTFVPPGAGGSYVDPQYGCTVVRLTNGIAQFGQPAHHYYGTIAAFNADDSKVMLFLDNAATAIVDINGNVVVGSSGMPASNTNVYPWDPVNAAVFYYTNSNQFLRATVSGGTVTSTALHTFSGYSSCSIPDQEDISDDGTKIWLVCTPSGGSASQNVAVLYNLATNSVVSNSLVVGAQEGGWHKIQIFPSGKMFLTGGSLCGGTQCIYNTDGTLYWQPPFTYSSHSDIGTDLQGREVLITSASGTASLNACGTEMWSSLSVIDINAKTPLNCLIGAPPNPKIPSWEISYRDSANTTTGKWVLLSMFDQGTCPDYSCFYPSDLISSWQSLWAQYYEELVLVKVDGSKTYRLGYSWSRSAENYWAVPRASISRSGKYLVFDSNFDISNTGFAQYTDVYLIKIQ